MKKTTRYLTLLLVLALMLPTAAMASEYKPMSSAYLSSYNAYINQEGNGKISINYYVYSTKTMTDVGATTILLQESADGKVWTAVASYSSSVYPHMLAHNTAMCNTDVSYSGVSGRYYKAAVTVYAGNSTGSDSRVTWTPTEKA